MYQSLLTRRYLLSKVMPMLAILCVALCSALLLVTWSIMGGFLVMLLDIGGRMEGDVSIAWPTAGFTHYDELIEQLEKDPMIVAAAPTIESFGMVTLADDRAIGVQIKGIDERFAKVTDYATQVWWRPLDEPLPKDYERKDPRLDPVMRPLFEYLYTDGLNLVKTDPTNGATKPAAVVGIETTGFTKRSPAGYYVPLKGVAKRTTDGQIVPIPEFVPAQRITIRVIPMDAKGRDMSTFVSRTVPIANEYRSGLYEADKRTIFLRLEELQRMLKMDAAERLEEERRDPYAVEGSGPDEKLAQRKVIGIEPARVTTVLVKARPGVNAEALRTRCLEIYGEVAARHLDMPTESDMSRTISTWERSLATFISAVKKETTMVVGLLLFMSGVCGVLILCIFWAMVSEKTKDIGILRAVGARSVGIAWLWLRYGLIIGVVGGLFGLLFGAMIVWNINPIHDWLGEQMGITLWDPNVYYFPVIPNKVEATKALWVISAAIVCCTLGALIPAVRAARMAPVTALRFE